MVEQFALIPLVYLEELHSNAGEHELQQRCDDQDVADGSDRHEDALHHILEEHEAQRTLHARNE